LGGAKALGTKPRNSPDWVCLIRKGFPTLALDALGRNISATNADLAQMLGISVRALAGRRCKKILSSYESERLLRVKLVIARSEDVFDDLANGFAWLKDTNISLGGSSPSCRCSTLILVQNWLWMFLAGSSTGFLPDNV
jgi:putative toxin-antitoxin system antitoxin component (TIGR02293 family)